MSIDKVELNLFFGDTVGYLPTLLDDGKRQTREYVEDGSQRAWETVAVAVYVGSYKQGN